MIKRSPLLVFGALPPARSGTADYLDEQLEHLAGRWKLTVVVGDESKVPAASDCEVLSYRAYQKTRSNFVGVPRLIHLANNPFHAHAFQEAERPGAILLLHEFSMHHLLTETTLAYGNSVRYAEELAKCDSNGRVISELRKQGVWSGIEQFLYPAIESRLRGAAGVIGHSKWILDRVQIAAPNLPTAHIPHHFSAPKPVDTNECRSTFGMPPDELAVVSLGFVTPAKCIEQIIHALSDIRDRVPRFKYWIFGEMRHPAQVRRAIKQCGMSDLVVEKGYLSSEDFQAAIQASDLVINLRYPTVGESSGTMTRAMGLGKPVVVYRHGSFAEPPKDTVIGVPLDTFDTTGLSESCCHALTDSGHRQAVGSRAKHWVCSTSPSDSVESQSNFIDQCHLNRGMALWK
ncbi:MAG TPA: hypothetical protein DEQ73_03605 [Phycisphaerales bacterium]|nr:hypothetical protein [Phycisphaerales bacterium]